MPNNILDSFQISGSVYDLKDKNSPSITELTQQEYDNLPSSAKTSNTLFLITDATPIDVSNYYTKSETSGATQISTALNGKQATLVSGTNIKTINNESILGSGNIDIQGGGGVNVVQTTGSSTTDVMSQDAVTTQLNGKISAINTDSDESYQRFYRFSTPSDFNYFILRNAKINGRQVLNSGWSSAINQFNLVETSAITLSVSSASTDNQVPSAKAVYDQFGGLKLVKLTQSEYDALSTKDSNTLYVIV